MIARFDSKGEVHLGDDTGMLDINVDAVARGILQAVLSARRKPRKRLAAKKGAK